jgi:hypothetical protein
VWPALVKLSQARRQTAVWPYGQANPASDAVSQANLLAVLDVDAGRLKMRDANSLFLARRFRRFTRDVLCISTSPSVQTRPSLNLKAGTFSLMPAKVGAMAEKEKEEKRNAPDVCGQQPDAQEADDVRFSAIFILIKGASMIAGAYLIMDDRALESIVLVAAGIFFAGCGIAGLLESRS